MVFNIVALIVCVLLASLFIYVRVTDGKVDSVLSKTLASFGFVLAGFFAFSKGQFLDTAWILIPAGLVCGMIGDILLELKVVYPIDDRIYLNSGMISFGLGHIFYAFGICIVASNFGNVTVPIIASLAVGLVLTVVIMFISGKMGIKFGSAFWQSAVYLFILATMVVLSIWLCTFNIMFIYFAIGMVLFFASDLILSMQYFGGKQDDPLFSIGNLSLYYLAQIMIVVFLMFS